MGFPPGVTNPTFRRLSASPYRQRIRVGSIGDSIAARGFAGGATFSYLPNNGFQPWMQVLSGNRLECRPSWNLAVSGTTSDQILATVNAAIALPIDALIIEGGTNDITQDIPYTTIFANMKAAIDAALTAGLLVIAWPIFPRTNNVTTARQRNLARYNAMLRNYGVGNPRLCVVDVWPYVAGSDGLPSSAANLVDGLHQSVIGADLYAQAGLAAIDQFLPKVQPYLVRNPFDLAEITIPYGNMVPNGMMLGTAGTTGTGIAAGTVADSYAVSTTATSNTGTVTPSIVPRTMGRGNWQQITIANRLGVASETISLSRSVDFSLGLYAPGDRIAFRVEFEVDAGSVNLINPYTRLIEQSGTGSTNFESRCLHPFDNTVVGPNRAYSGVLESDPITVRSVAADGTRALSLNVQTGLVTTTAASAVVRFGAVTLIKMV